MRNTMGLSAAAWVLSGLAQPALADTAETRGGMAIKSDDGAFSASLGGRIHFDINLFDNDEDSFATGTFACSGGAACGTPVAAGSRLTPDNSTAYLRRVYLTLKGKVYDWNYKVEADLANNTATGGTSVAFQEVTMSTAVLGGELILGQLRPFRSMEDLTSSNDHLLAEKPGTSSNGLFAGREFQQGVGYKVPLMPGLLAEASLFALRSSTTAANQGAGYNARVAYAPLMQDGLVVHAGASYSYENASNDPGKVPGSAFDIAKPVFQYAGRRGPTLGLGSTSGSEPARTFGLELAGVFGPVFFQGEYADSTLALQAPTALQDPEVKALYVQAAWDITGEHKPYKPADGVFGSVKPRGEHGAFELAARYDTASDDRLPVGGCAVTTTAGNPGNTNGSSTVNLTNSTACKGTAITAGLNWYPNPSMRFMLNYVTGKADAGASGIDKARAIVLRSQIAF